MGISVVSYLMKHFYNDSLIKLHYLRQESGTSRLWTLALELRRHRRQCLPLGLHLIGREPDG
jgi:hypothetical protein